MHTVFSDKMSVSVAICTVNRLRGKRKFDYYQILFGLRNEYYTDDDTSCYCTSGLTCILILINFYFYKLKIGIPEYRCQRFR